MFANRRRMAGLMARVASSSNWRPDNRREHAQEVEGSQPYRHGLCPAAAPLAVKLIPKV